jgi:phage terminase Nu1 subunit (DNA packaging protein)
MGTTAPARKTLTIAGYAKRRGCAHRAVEVAIQSGRLSRSITKDGRKTLIDAALADAEWAANTDESLNPAKTPATFAESRARHEAAKAGLAEVKLRERLGELVQAADVKANLEDVFARCRTKLLGISSRLQQQLPHLSASDLGVVDSLLREALEDLAENGADE